jgi:hypothetical protein
VKKISREKTKLNTLVTSNSFALQLGGAPHVTVAQSPDLSTDR